MYKLTLEWEEGDRVRTRTITADDQTIVADAIRIGRSNPQQCDILLYHPDANILMTVSGLHIEIYFDRQQNNFYLRNLTKDRQPPKRPNPAIVDGKKIVTKDAPIRLGSQIQLGKMQLRVKALEVPQTNTFSYVVTCSGPKHHKLDPQYVGLNCPHCGYLVQIGTMLVSN